MHSSKQHVPPIAIRPPPHLDFCVGHPGVPASRPRLVGTVEIRSPGKILSISHVTIALHRYESIHPPSAASLSSLKREYSTIVGDEVRVFQAPGGHADVVAMDLPFELPFSNSHLDNPPPSVSLANGMCETSYQLVAILYPSKGSIIKFGMSVKIERFDLLSTWGMYNQPQTKEVDGSDHLITMEVALPKTCIGPGDPLIAYVKLCPNPDWSKSRKIRISKLQSILEETITFKLEKGEEITRRRKILKDEFDLYDLKLPAAGFIRDISCVFPSQLRLKRSPSGLKMNPTDCSTTPSLVGITTQAALFSVEYTITVKAILLRAKDISVTQAITVCPLDRSACLKAMSDIDDAVRQARISENRPKERPQSHIVTMVTNTPGKRILVE